MIDVTFITPCAPVHTGLLSKCIESVKAQTVLCNHLIGIDKGMQGAGYVRNVLLKKVTTPFVVFLDADDYVIPTFAERTLSAIQPHSYVYTAWFGSEYKGEYASKMESSRYHQDGLFINIPHAPRDVWTRGFHLITSLIATDDARRVGFDPYMRGMEDTDFWLKQLTDYCLCPIRITEPLIHYTNNGIRSRAIIETGENNVIKNRLLERYGNKMACCGGIHRTAMNTIGEKLDGDVLIQALWGGNRNYRGKATGRLYGRLSHPARFWGSLADAQADPTQLQVIDTDYMIQDTEFIEDEVLVVDSADENAQMTIGKAMGLSTVQAPKKGGTDVKPNIKKVTGKKS